MTRPRSVKTRGRTCTCSPATRPTPASSSRTTRGQRSEGRFEHVSSVEHGASESVPSVLQKLPTSERPSLNGAAALNCSQLTLATALSCSPSSRRTAVRRRSASHTGSRPAASRTPCLPATPGRMRSSRSVAPRAFAAPLGCDEDGAERVLWTRCRGS